MTLRSIGVYFYRFWSKAMHTIKRRSKGHWLHCESADYREKILHKINAYHVFVQVSYIAQGALQFFCAHHAAEVWGSFRGFMRTIRRDLAPSECLASVALQNGLPKFITGGDRASKLGEIFCPKLNLKRLPETCLAA